MKNPFVRCIPLLALLLPAPLAAAQETEPKPQSIRYEIRYLDPHAAEVLAWDQCTRKEKCQIATLPGSLVVDAEPAVQEKVARALAKADATPRTRNLQILLLSAAMKPGATADNVPENARKALDDIRKFLPFKSYQIVDAAWMSATERQVAQGRLAGSGGAYQVKLRFQTTGDQATPTLYLDHFELRQEVVLPTKDGPHYDYRQLIDTSFSVKVGETVVVGTSRADGADGALVVLLTAAPAS